MAAGFLIRRFLLILVLSEIKYSSVFPSVGSRGSLQVTFDPGFHHHHHHHKPINPLTKYLWRLKEGLLELPKLLHHKHDQTQCCDGDSKVPHYPVKPPIPICGSKLHGPDCPVKQSPKWPIFGHWPSHHHLHLPFHVLRGLLCHQHPCPHGHTHDHDDHCSGHQHHCGLHKHHHGPVFYHPHHGPGHHHHHHHHPHHHKDKTSHHGCDPLSKLC